MSPKEDVAEIGTAKKDVAETSTAKEDITEICKVKEDVAETGNSKEDVEASSAISNSTETGDIISMCNDPVEKTNPICYTSVNTVSMLNSSIQALSITDDLADKLDVEDSQTNLTIKPINVTQTVTKMKEYELCLEGSKVEEAQKVNTSSEYTRKPLPVKSDDIEIMEKLSHFNIIHSLSNISIVVQERNGLYKLQLPNFNNKVMLNIKDVSLKSSRNLK